MAMPTALATLGSNDGARAGLVAAIALARFTAARIAALAAEGHGIYAVFFFGFRYGVADSMKTPSIRIFADEGGQFYLRCEFERCDMLLALIAGMSGEAALAVARCVGVRQLRRHWESAPVAAIGRIGLSAGIVASMCFEVEGASCDLYSTEGLRRYLDAVSKARIDWHDDLGVGSEPAHD